MLIRVATLKQIKAGKVTLAFRRWRKPTVKSGGTLNTAIGQLVIEEVSKATERSITKAQATAAGFESKTQLLEELAGRDGDIYRIKLAYTGIDPRETLRVDKDDLAPVLKRLDRMGCWTKDVLSAIKHHPRIRAADLAEKLDCEKDWLKTNVRKLKNLGLTISHEVGYELSPRGKAVLKQLR